MSRPVHRRALLAGLGTSAVGGLGAAAAVPASTASAAAPTSASGSADEAGAVATTTRTTHLVRLRQVLEGTAVPLSDVPDPTFAQEIMGPGIAVQPADDLLDAVVVAPAAGTVQYVFDTGHAVALTLDDGTEVLIHVGLDTVAMKGRGFETLVAPGDRVVAGMPLLRVDLAAVRADGHPTITPVVVLNDKDAVVELV